MYIFCRKTWNTGGLSSKREKEGFFQEQVMPFVFMTFLGVFLIADLKS